MKPITLIFIFEVIGAQVILYHPQNTVSVFISNIAVISCVSNVSLEAGTRIQWYRATWTPGNRYLRVKSCLHDNDTWKYICENDQNEARLKIYGAQLKDSGAYHCAYNSDISMTLSNGTSLIVRSNFTSTSTIYLLAPLKPFPTKMPIQLFCLLRSAHHVIHMTWNISGKLQMGKIISMEEPGGTWTFLNDISLPISNQGSENHVTCEVWFGSFPVQVHWDMPTKDYVNGNLAMQCQSVLIYTLLGGVLLLFGLVSHLIWMYKKEDEKSERSKRKNSMTEDEIIYAHLNHLKKETSAEGAK